jgi:hypothetical protein
MGIHETIPYRNPVIEPVIQIADPPLFCGVAGNECRIEYRY